MTPPMHIREGRATPWKIWFAWRPVRTEQGAWVWWRSTWRRRFYAAAWFDPAPYDGWWEYSDTRENFWESCKDPTP